MRLRHYISIFLISCLLTSCTARSPIPQSPAPPSPPDVVPVEPVPAAPEPPPPLRATLLAVGDNLIHDVIYQQAQTSDGYNFLSAYQAVAPQIAQADIAFINQETPIVAEAPPSSYPLFNSPPELADTLYQLGFDVINLANNHMLDQYASGLESTLDILQSHGKNDEAVIGVNGAACVVERNGICFGFTAFTQHSNGLVLPQDKQDMITYTSQTQKMQQQIEQLENQADLTVVSVHWGEENTTQPTHFQQELAQQLAQWGADIIIGTHPHVLQPVEWVTSPNGNRAIVLYSLGNFISAQADRPNLVGGMALLEVEKDRGLGKTTVKQVQLHPIVTCYGSGYSQLHLLPFADYTDELAAQHGVQQKCGQALTRSYVEQLVTSVIAPQFLPEKTFE